MLENTIKYIVIKKEKETHDVFRLSLITNDKLPSYVAGQVISIYYPELYKNKGKEYSISSAPSENLFEITVKRMGIFSEMITNKNTGDIIVGSLPYGHFYTESNDSDLTFLAGGIGAAPFISMIVESLNVNPNRKINLFYSNKKYKDIIFKNKLDNLASLHKNTLRVFYYVTRETSNEINIKNKRIPIEDVFDNYTDNSEFFICGSNDFVVNYYKILIRNKIAEQRIFTEDFS